MAWLAVSATIGVAQSDRRTAHQDAAYIDSATIAVALRKQANPCERDNATAGEPTRDVPLSERLAFAIQTYGGSFSRWSRSATIGDADSVLLANWLMRFPAEARVSLRAAGQSAVLCAATDQKVLAFRLGPTAAGSLELRPSQLAESLSAFQDVTAQGITVLAESVTVAVVARQIQDSLGLLEALLKSRAARPSIVVAFRSIDVYGSSMPAVGDIAQRSLRNRNRLSISFVYPTARGMTKHELVHLVFRPIDSVAAVRGDTIQPEIEEALARGLDGKASGRLASYAKRAGVPLRRFVWQISQDSGARQLGPYDRNKSPNIASELLSGLMLVALLECADFPQDVQVWQRMRDTNWFWSYLTTHLQVTELRLARNTARALRMTSAELLQSRQRATRRCFAPGSD
jgi:hypothetical protein